MKLRIVATGLLIMVLSLCAASEASARPWGCRGGWNGPRWGGRVVVPAPVVYGGGYYRGCGPRYHERRHCEPRYYDRGRGYDRY